jgi:hypothetical protein
MRFQTLYAAFAVILPVALGLGLVYLSSIGRIDGYTALMATVVIAVAMGGAVAARDSTDGRGQGDTNEPE